MMGGPHMHGISTTHSDHDKYSMVLACFIVVMVFLILVIALLGVSAHRQGSMLNNSNTAMAQITSLKKALVTAKGAQKAGATMPRKAGFSNGLMGTNGAREFGGSIGAMHPGNWGSDSASRLAQVNQGGDMIGTGQGLRAIIGGECSSANGSCGANDNYMAYSDSTGGMNLPLDGMGGSGGDNELIFFKDVLGTIAQDVHVNKVNNGTNMGANMGARAQGARSNAAANAAARAQGARANMASQRQSSSTAPMRM